MIIIKLLLVSAARCDFPEEILNGTIIFTDNNTANIMVGDAIAYNCAVNMKLHGPRERVCMKTGNWSGSQPQCVGQYLNCHYKYLGFSYKTAYANVVYNKSCSEIQLPLISSKK